MTFNGFPERAFDFYEGLTADNSRTYWQTHRAVYVQAVQEPFEQLLAELAAEFGGRVHHFRPNRDVRFSADKSPYKTNRAALVAVADGVGYHLSLDAEGVSVGGGFHTQDRAVLARFRAAVDAAGGAELASIVAALAGSGFELGGTQVATRPRGVPADHPRLDLMRREYLTASRRHEPEDTTGPEFLAAARADWLALRPLVGWLAAALA